MNCGLWIENRKVGNWDWWGGSWYGYFWRCIGYGFVWKVLEIEKGFGLDGRRMGDCFYGIRRDVGKLKYVLYI